LADKVMASTYVEWRPECWQGYSKNQSPFAVRVIFLFNLFIVFITEGVLCKNPILGNLVLEIPHSCRYNHS